MAVLLNGTNGLIQAYDYQVLTTGFSYVFAAGTQTLVLNPAGTLATGTITMPASPSDGMVITFSSTKQITALTLNGNTGQTVVGGVSYLPANTAVAYVYRLSNTSWFPLQAVPVLAAQPLGYGQTWQAVTRTSGTTYTNSTGRPIFVSFQVTGTGANGGLTVAVNGSNQYTGSINTGNSGYMQGVYTFIANAGDTYTATLSNASMTAYELR